MRGLASSIGGSLPDLLLKREAGATTFVEEEGGLLNSLSTVLLQEMAKFNKLITVSGKTTAAWLPDSVTDFVVVWLGLLQVMRSSLVDLIRAIRGLVVMSAALDEMYTSMLNNQVPSIWRRVAYPSLKPLGAWVQDLHYRVKFFRQWLRQGLPTSFPLPAFFFPQVCFPPSLPPPLNAPGIDSSAAALTTGFHDWRASAVCSQVPGAGECLGI